MVVCIKNGRSSGDREEKKKAAELRPIWTALGGFVVRGWGVRDRGWVYAHLDGEDARVLYRSSRAKVLAKAMTARSSFFFLTIVSPTVCTSIPDTPPPRLVRVLQYEDMRKGTLAAPKHAENCLHFNYRARASYTTSIEITRVSRAKPIAPMVF